MIVTLFILNMNAIMHEMSVTCINVYKVNMSKNTQLFERNNCTIFILLIEARLLTCISSLHTTPNLYTN